MGCSVGGGVVGAGVGTAVSVASNAILGPVPITAATAMVAACGPMESKGLEQRAAVDEVQLVVEHTALPSKIEGVASIAPNCKPARATGACPELGTFCGWTELTTGASKVMSLDDVPTKPLIVTVGGMLAPDPPPAKLQATVVAEVHDVVVHSA